MSRNVVMLRPPSKDESALHERQFVYDQLLGVVQSTKSTDLAPWLVKELFRVEAWRERPSALGRLVPAGDLHRFIHDKPPDGLGTTYAAIERLIRDDVEALSLWTEATRKEPGRPSGTVYNVHDKPPAKPEGNSRESAIRRLNKAAAEGDERAVEKRADVLAGKISPHRAAVDLGWRKKRTAYQEMCSAWARATEDDRSRFEGFIADWRRREVP